VIDTSTATTLGWIYAFDGEIVDEGAYDFTNPEIEEAFSYLKSLYDRGCAWLSKNRFPDPDFAERRALITTSSTAGIPFQEEAMDTAESDDEWIALPFPSDGEEPVMVVSGPSYAMVESTPEGQLATWILVKWLLEPENQARWIRVSGHLPSRKSTLDILEGYRQGHPQWAQAAEWIPFARTEPDQASWSTVRWALSDAAEQIFRLNLTLDQIPPLLEELDQTAAELRAQSR
jgi:ABC-type glycerol-3-phosphate transport system substrate-binding protein